jgi:hypothetical protein
MLSEVMKSKRSVGLFILNSPPSVRLHCLSKSDHLDIVLVIG